MRFPRDLPRADEIYGGDDDWMARGNTTICGPDGESSPVPSREEAKSAAVFAGHAPHAAPLPDEEPVEGRWPIPDLL